jgi:hypothetical protein
MLIYNLDQHALELVLSTIDCLDKWAFALTTKSYKKITKALLTKRDLAEIRYYIPIHRNFYYNIEELCCRGFLASLSRVIDNDKFEPCEELNKDYMMRISCTSGHLDVVKFFHSRGSQTTHSTFVDVCEEGHIDVAKWLYKMDEIPPRYIERALSAAIENGHCDVIEWLKSTLDCIKLCLSDEESYIESHITHDSNDLVESFKRFCLKSYDVAKIKRVHQLIGSPMNPSMMFIPRNVKMFEETDDVILWIYKTFGSIEDLATQVYEISKSNRVTVMRYLWEECKKYNIVVDTKAHIAHACATNHLDMAKLLCELSKSRLNRESAIEVLTKLSNHFDSRNTAKWLYYSHRLTREVIGENNLREMFISFIGGSNIILIRWMCDTYKITKSQIKDYVSDEITSHRTFAEAFYREFKIKLTYVFMF